MKLQKKMIFFIANMLQTPYAVRFSHFQRTLIKSQETQRE